MDASWRGMLEVAFLGFVDKIFGGAPGERHDRERRILVRIGNQWSAIRHEEILHVVRLAKAIQHGCFRIGAHARGADFVNNLATRLASKRKAALDGSPVAVLAAHAPDYGAEC